MNGRMIDGIADTTNCHVKMRRKKIKRRVKTKILTNKYVVKHVMERAGNIGPRMVRTSFG